MTPVEIPAALARIPGILDRMPRPLNLPEPFDEGTFRVRDARAERVPTGSLRTLANPVRGVRSHADPESIPDRFSALQLVRPSGIALSHCSAARVHRLPVPRGCEHEGLHVMTAGDRIRRRGIVAHRGLDDRRLTTRHGVPVTDLADTWLDLAPFVGLEDLIILGDAVAQRIGGTDPLHARLSRHVKGVRRARAALTWIRLGSASPMETRSRVLFTRVGLPEPELNVEIHDPDGGWLATGDLVWREAKVVGEYQGKDHFADYARGDQDIVRRRVVEAIGWTYVDFTKDDYFRRPRRLALVRRMADALGCVLDPIALAAIGTRAGLPGEPLCACGG